MIKSEELAKRLIEIFDLPPLVIRMDIIIEVNKPVVLRCESYAGFGLDELTSTFREYELVPKGGT